MRLKNKISITKAICEARLFKKKTPLMVSWALSYRCNRRCIYCRIWELSRQELSTSEVISMIDKFSSLGMQCITFTGGEPLVREDIGDIVTYASRKGIFTKINSNGSMIPRRISALGRLNSLSLSFDGPEEIQDYIRGQGSYAEVMEAVRVAKGHRINVSFLAVLSKINLNYIDFILESAKKFQIAVLFQPAASLLLGSGEKNPVSCPSDEYERAISKLIADKMTNRYDILNSARGLRHLCRWPNQHPLPCTAGKISFRVEPNGQVHSCFKQAFYNLPDISCRDCWCGTQVEINYLAAWNINAILNSIRWV